MQNIYHCYKNQEVILCTKKVLEYVYNYAQYIVTYGKNEVICVCMSAPLPDGIEPERGMVIAKIYAFGVEGIFLKKLLKKKI